MKKILYLFLTVSLIFSSCKKDDDDDTVTPVAVLGCTDEAATNYDADADTDDSSCLYLITGCWEWQTGVVNETDVFSAGISEVVLYFWDDGEYGVEYYIPGDVIAAYDIGTYSLSSDQTTMNTTSMTYEFDGVGYVTDGEATTTNLNIAKFNSVEFDAGWNDNDGIGDFTSNKSSDYFLNDWK